MVSSKFDAQSDVNLFFELDSKIKIYQGAPKLGYIFLILFCSIKFRANTAKF